MISMSNIEKYPKCHMRTSLGNCDPIGGFCTSVNATVCEALHKVAEPKTGEWILMPMLPVNHRYKCSICKRHHRERYDYCPSCGARMLKEDGEEE